MVEIDNMDFARIMQKKVIDMNPEEIKLVTDIEKRMIERIAQKRERLVAEFNRVHQIRQDLRTKYGPDKLIDQVAKLNLTYPDGHSLKKKKTRSDRERRERITNKDFHFPQREEDCPKCLAQQQLLHKHKQQQEVELSRLRHPEDLQEKNRLARMLDDITIFKDKIASKRAVEHDRLMRERVERIGEVLQIRKQERETKRKMLFYLKTEEEKLWKLQEELEAHNLEEAERKKIGEVEQKTKLDKIAERRRPSEIEEKVARKVFDLWRRPCAIIEPSAAAALQSEPVIAAPPSSGSKLIFV